RMQRALPDVLTLRVPSEPDEYARILADSRAFERLSWTEEDRRRTEMYQEQGARREFARSAGSIDEFLRGLEMTASGTPVDEWAFPRVLDLLRKTNQFNLTTRRHAATHLEAFLADPDCGVFALRVSDRFGDHGIVGVAIVRMREKTAHVDSFLLSCRVIGR